MVIAISLLITGLNMLVTVMLVKSYSKHFNTKIGDLSKLLNDDKSPNKFEVEFGIANGYYLSNGDAELKKIEYDYSHPRFIKYEGKYYYSIMRNDLKDGKLNCCITAYDRERNLKIYNQDSKLDGILYVCVPDLHKINFNEHSEPPIKKTYLVTT